MTAPIVPACIAVIERRGDRLIRIRLPQTGFDAVFGWVGFACMLTVPFGMIMAIFFGRLLLSVRRAGAVRDLWVALLLAATPFDH